MADVPQAAIEVVARMLLRLYESENPASHLTWRDFAGEARELLEAATPHIAVDAALAERERICAWLDQVASTTTEDTVRRSYPAAPDAAPLAADAIRSVLSGVAAMLRDPEGATRGRPS